MCAPEPPASVKEARLAAGSTAGGLSQAARLSHLPPTCPGRDTGLQGDGHSAPASV